MSDDWHHFLSGVRPLQKKKNANLRVRKQWVMVGVRERPEHMVMPHVESSAGGHIESKKRLKRVVVEDRLDLHGYKLEEAFQEFKRFLERSVSRRYKLVLVITGKGLRGRMDDTPHRPRLRDALPQWIQVKPLKEMVYYITQAGEEHGGAGAFYIVLRRSSPTF